MTWIAGVDGCRGGWTVVLREVSSGQIVFRLAVSLSEVIAWQEGVEVVCVDVPIGLLDAAEPGGRECDRLARSLLGHPRGCSVFSPPVRSVLGVTDYREAVRFSRESSPHKLGISRQCHAIVGKIQEADSVMTPELQDTIVEVHPEVTFAALNGGKPILKPKKRVAGRQERLELLQGAWGRDLAGFVADNRSEEVAPDDIIDAMAACWTAERVLRGSATRLPAKPPRDSRGLRMEIVR